MNGCNKNILKYNAIGLVQPHKPEGVWTCPLRVEGRLACGLQPTTRSQELLGEASRSAAGFRRGTEKLVLTVSQASSA
ncbi:hypothetical protein TNIN_171121 [Trichonephila inaurata madagascariensis]|uniref:Uncharacterized protein n=1 Tax=Trichonephila inaurata madagascariensis TaxID=2747483 RepID=A0A8X7CBP0_9ARAC|nr:hypothetical protein TNIN_171121 [Trichonephila inaurata madagascariensis]